ncbi:MAG: hypothetical protein U0794_00725 [Isosphaeraceae bacterium]
MERVIEFFLALTALTLGASHIVQADVWVDTYRRLTHLGQPGAFINGALSLVTGTFIVSGHNSWRGPGAVLTVFGWLLVTKGVVCFLAPEVALRSMERSPSRRRFMIGGLFLMFVGVWAGFCWWAESSVR